MSNPTQATRHIAIETPLGEDVLLLQSFSAHEEISRLFEFDLKLLSENYEINFDDIVGQNVTISMELPGGGKRYWNGFINRFVQGVSTSVQFAQYRATMVPWLWFLTHTSDCRIFQNKTVPDIVKQIFNDLGFSDIEDRLSGGYQIWNYCVQYRETDFNFVSRLMEQEGIYYYFLHEQSKNTIVLCDSRSKHDPYGDYEKIEFTPDTKASSQQERIREWTVEKIVQPGKFAHTDYNFQKPSTSLMSTQVDQKDHDRSDYEIYDYPGVYSEKADGDKYAKIRMEELANSHEVCSGQSDSRGICMGFLFKMAKHTRRDQNREYLILSTNYQAVAEDYETSGGQGEMCSCSFTTIPNSVQFRPDRITPKPSVQGAQTAVVTGPKGEEIYTDEHGRVKVQFHWDREGNRDENSSCWMRVSQLLAGKGWGAIFIPRIGHEVIVDFIEGDPDRPIITGRVYNGRNKTPYILSKEKTKSTIKSNSSIGGEGFNEIRFEDKKDIEEIFIHAQKNQNEVVNNDMSTIVGNDRTLTVENDRTTKINKGDDKLTVEKGDREIYVTEGDHELIVGKGDRFVKIKTGESELSVRKKIYIESEESEIVIEAAKKITLEVGGGVKKGGSELVMKSDGSIGIEGKNIAIEGNESIAISGGSITSDAQNDHNIGGTTVRSEAKGPNVVKGGTVMLNP